MREVERVRPIPTEKKLLVFLMSGLVRLICMTLRLRVIGEEETAAVVRKGGAVLATWHGRTLIPIDRFRGRHDYHGVISNSRDGDIQAQIFRTRGMGVIRGSTGRRGVTATREVLSVLSRGEVILFTPDGPRGPTQKIQPGIVYFAQRSGRPIIPAGVSANPRWLLGTWDRFLIPKPFCRARLIYGEPIYITPDEDPEAAARRVEDALNHLEAQAEREVGIGC